MKGINLFLAICILMGMVAFPVHAIAPEGWIIVPAVGMYLPIHESPIINDYHQIGSAANHLEETTWTTDNWGRVVIAGHNPGWFSLLLNIAIGDRIIVYTPDQTDEFEVISITVIDNDIQWLAPTPDYELLLLTCLDRGTTWLAVRAMSTVVQ